MLLFPFATDHRHIVCSSWSRGVSEKSRNEFVLLAQNPCFKESVPNSPSARPLISRVGSRDF